MIKHIFIGITLMMLCVACTTEAPPLPEDLKKSEPSVNTPQDTAKPKDDGKPLPTSDVAPPFHAHSTPEEASAYQQYNTPLFVPEETKNIHYFGDKTQNTFKVKTFTDPELGLSFDVPADYVIKDGFRHPEIVVYQDGPLPGLKANYILEHKDDPRNNATWTITVYEKDKKHESDWASNASTEISTMEVGDHKFLHFMSREVANPNGEVGDGRLDLFRETNNYMVSAIYFNWDRQRYQFKHEPFFHSVATIKD